MKFIYMRLSFLIWLLLGLCYFKTQAQHHLNKYHLQGLAQGTTYSIIYYADKEVVKKSQIDNILSSIDSSLSIYKSYSLISRFNDSEKGIIIDKHLKEVVKKALEISHDTGGAFDITILPLVQVWGFGTGKIDALPDSSTIRKLLKYVGPEKIKLEDNELHKANPGVKIDVNGIAQGYTVDILADHLTENNIDNYLVELGGEIRVKGRKPGGELMTIGIEGPRGDDASSHPLKAVVRLPYGAVTTSGNYRKFVESNNDRLSHLIDPETGYPIRNENISATVWAHDAITADGYDNALMGMEWQKALQFVDQRDELEAYLIYRKENGSIADTATAGFLKIISTEATPEQTVQKKINPELLTDPWKANWITHPDIAPKAYGVFHARKSFDLANDPEQFIVHITADNRFRLYVNGRHVTEGPARGDLLHWRFETIDIASFLKSGKNTIAVVFWNFGEYKALSQISNQTAFLMQGNTANEEAVNTDGTWKIVQNKSYQPIPFGPIAFHGYYVVGPGEKIDASQYLWGWQESDYDDSNWNRPVVLGAGTPQGNNSHQNWLLVQDQLPLMENIPQHFKSIRRSSGVSVADDFVAGKNPVQIPANSHATILFDNGENTTAFPELSINGGKGAVIRLTYGEAMFDDNYRKGNRNEVEGKKIFGNYDEFTSDGGRNRVFSTLYYRTFRYVQMDIQTGAEPVVLQDFRQRFTAYPFQENATFNSSDPMLKEIWNIGWRTARLCAYDTYMDTPYYEQLQYVADTRIQALISLYVSGDDRLMRNAIELIHNSMVPEGITQSRYPTELPQFIPNFSLYWISTLHDYWRYRSDDVFLKQYLPAMRSIISWFENKITDKDMVGLLPYWDFTDHSYKTKEIAQAGKGEEGITPNTLQFAYTLRQAADLFDYFGETHDAERYRQLAKKLVKSTVEHTYDQERQLFADTPAKKSYSQHGNIFAVLTNAIPREQQPSLLDRIITLPDLVQQTIYFRFYLGQAFKEAGVADRYLENLDPWRTAVNLGFTTFPEGPEPTRSDCHAWSASPNYEFLATVCGIESASPGFKTVKIVPALGSLEFIEGTMPHPSGEIRVKFSKKGKSGLMGEVTLPAGLSGHFEYNGVKIKLKEGFQKIRD